MAAALPPDSASCSRLYCQLRGLGHGFCAEHDNKDESNNLNITEASCWSLILWSPMSSTLCSAWLWLQTVSLQDLFTHPFPVAWPFFLSHTLPLYPPGKVADTWKIISLWPWGLLQLLSEENMKEVPKTGEEKWVPKVFFLFSFLNFHVFDYDIFLPQPISDDAFFS